MATLSGQATLFGQAVNVSLTLDDEKATKWIEDHIKAQGYDQLTDANGDPLTVEAQGTLALADAGKLYKQSSIQYERQLLRRQNRINEKAVEDDPVYDSGVILPV